MANVSCSIFDYLQNGRASGESGHAGPPAAHEAWAVVFERNIGSQERALAVPRRLPSPEVHVVYDTNALEMF